MTWGGYFPLLELFLEQAISLFRVILNECEESSRRRRGIYLSLGAKYLRFARFLPLPKGGQNYLKIKNFKLKIINVGVLSLSVKLTKGGFYVWWF